MGVGVRYCKKCDKTYPNDAQFCSKCGNNLVKLVEETKSTQISKKPTNWKLYGLIAVVIIVIGIVAYIKPWETWGRIIEPSSQRKESCPFECCFNDERYETRVCQGSNYQCVNNKCVKTNCPYECCPEGEYRVKPCQTDYECVNNKCVAIDSDKDGLTDIEERQLGTNLNLADSDGDGLTDYQEVKVYSSNPLRMNSDCDRYNDGEEVQKGYNPTNPNSAKLNAQITNKDLGIDLTIVLSLIMGAIDLDQTILNPTISYSVANTGDDYTSYANFKIQLTIGGHEVDSHTIQLQKIDKGQTIADTVKYTVKMKQLSSIVVNLLKQYYQTKKIDWDATIQNLNYEEYTGC